jgi:hypothetical protein
MEDLPLEALLQKYPEDAHWAAQLAKQLAAEAYLPALQLLRLESEADGAVRLEASLGLMSLGCLALKPLSELGPPTESFDRLHYIQRLSSLQETARAGVVEAIDALLDDRRPLPTSTEANAPVQTRVRDHAYLAMKQLVRFTNEKAESELRKFLAQPWQFRDEEIEHRRHGPRWQASLELAPPKHTGPQPTERIGAANAERTRAAYRTELLALKAGKPFDLFQARVDSDSMGKLFALLALSRRDEPRTTRTARLVMSHMAGGLLLRPLLQLGPPAAPAARAEYVSDLILAEKQLREVTVESLRKLLDDPRMVPQYEPAGETEQQTAHPATPEEAEEPRRICDEAYLALSTLQHFADREQQRLIKLLVVQASLELRDRLLARAKSYQNYEGPSEAEFEEDHRTQEAHQQGSSGK